MAAEKERFKPMTNPTKIDTEQVRRLAEQLADAAERLREQRPQLLARLANGDGIRPAVKVKDDVKVTIGIPPFEHSGSRAGETVAGKIRSCGDAYEAVEEGLRAMASVMSKMAMKLRDSDQLSADEMNELVAGLHSVAVVGPGEEPEPVDWFGLGK